MTSASDINFVLDRIRAPELTVSYFLDFISRLACYKNEEFIDALMDMVSRSQKGSDEFWISGYLYALCQMIERPYRRDDKAVVLFVGKLRDFVSGKSSAEIGWYSGSLLGMIDHPNCSSARVEGVYNSDLYIRGRIECLRGIVDFHPADQVIEIVSFFALDASSPLFNIANLIFADIKGRSVNNDK